MTEYPGAPIERQRWPQVSGEPDSTSHQLWYAHADDLIGAWAVMNCDKPPSEANHQVGEYQIGSGWSEWTTRHIVWLHNDWLTGEDDHDY
jgi:hypothetical protein